jgi:formylglycine-generating enzyme required for sulfatase activity
MSAKLQDPRSTDERVLPSSPHGGGVTEHTLDVEGRDARAPSDWLPERYEDLRLLGTGGFGEVRRVYDRTLERVVAMKTLLAGTAASSALSNARFLSEIKVTAGLSHPGIVAVFDHGALPDGRLWYTMPEVRGTTLRARIDARASEVSDGASSQRALLEAFARVCETVAYAHSRGVIHRDLKPENIMIGEFGESLVMDWGLARRVDARDSHATILGTPSYMAPEQARGDVDAHGPPTDVFALGVILRQLLAARPASVVEPEPTVDPPEYSLELSRIAARAMAHDPAERFRDAGAMAVDVRAALDGARRFERAAEALAAAMRLVPSMRALEREAMELRARASRALGALSPDSPASEKEPAWRDEDEAAQREGARAVLEARWLQSVHGALQIDPTCRDAHAALAAHYADELRRAERARRSVDAARFEELLRAHDRGEHAAMLSGLAQVTLVTDPPGAKVTAYRYELRARRLVADGVTIPLGRTPIERATLPRGSYLLVIEREGHAPVRYPVALERGEHWDGCAPGERAPRAVALPRRGEVGEGEVYVPCGYAWIGGDANAIESLPARRVWIESFVAGRFAVTNEEYLLFLDDLVAQGREDEALAASPRSNRGAGASPADALSFSRSIDGRFRLRTDDPGERWTLRSPVVLVSCDAASAYARWLAERTGLPYRLLHELEREKSVRGADGRCFSWGDHFEPTWTRVAQSTRASASRADVDEYPLDESPYGLRHGVGNTRDFCLNAWSIDGPSLDGDRLRVDLTEPDADFRSVRGGAWSSVEHHCRAASRFANRADDRRSAIGVRVGRSFR